MRRVLASFLATLSLMAACTANREPSPEEATKPVREADVRCESTERARFYAENATYEDVDAIDLPVANPSEADVDASPLEAATEELERSDNVLSFLVMRDGKLLWERYFNGSRAHHAENVHSVAKSLLSLVAGRAIEQRKLALGDNIDEYLPKQLVPAGARDLRVKDLLTMSGGLRWEENVTEETLDDDVSYVRQILSAPRAAERGKEFAYSTGLTQVLSAVIAEATGSSVCAYAHKEILSPIGVSIDHWLTQGDGYDAGGHSTFMTPRELALIGRFVLDDGEGELDEEWLDRSFAQVWDRGCRAPSERLGYGYLWWRSDIGGVEVISADGYGGQALMIVPSLDVVVVVTHDTFGEPKRDIVPPIELLTNYVFPAVGAKFDPDAHCGAFDVHRVDIDGGGEQRLTNDPSLDIWGSPSPDGEQIAFASRRDLNWEIYVMDESGKDDRRLTRDRATDGMPAWSPDGDRIVFAKDGARTGLYTMTPGGSRQRRLTEGRDLTPAWSPDGDRVAFNRNTDGEGALWTVDIDSGRETKLRGGAGGVAPAFSADGKTIVFYTADEGAQTVYTVDAAGGQPQKIGPGRDPRWLSDGSLVYAARGGVDDTWRIVRSTNGDITTIVDLDGDELLPIPSADGRWLTFSSEAARPPSAEE